MNLLKVNTACAILAQTRGVGAVGARHIVEVMEVTLSKMKSVRGFYSVETIGAALAEMGQPLTNAEAVALEAVAAARNGG
ncbi:hypothetical protein FGK63_14240 [Ruegeria sediminis]|uniref:Ribosomal protein L7/L12 C-terminal domain-containing protein n=1 Tax=Ruegeria sediminis TaxID=2583820 RepID=A0ABY2WUN5_9RHOB|nr:hypothetical protein [Ruegeria sediminis]TMV06314.1 hypothetical protein FGK63_14240 [Ruegeria sediminis]